MLFIWQAVDQTTVLLFPPRMLILLVKKVIISRAKLVHHAQFSKSSFNLHVHSFGVRLACGSNCVFSSDAIYKKLYSLCCSPEINPGKLRIVSFLGFYFYSLKNCKVLSVNIC